jgi:hypothetical protein
MAYRRLAPSCAPVTTNAHGFATDSSRPPVRDLGPTPRPRRDLVAITLTYDIAAASLPVRTMAA